MHIVTIMSMKVSIQYKFLYMSKALELMGQLKIKIKETAFKMSLPPDIITCTTWTFTEVYVIIYSCLVAKSKS